MWQLYSSENGQSYTLTGKTMILGRSQECDIVLFGEGVSRQHALLEITPDGWLIRDLESSNGTFVDGQRIQNKLLSEGNRVGLGAHCTLVITQEHSEEPSESTGNNSSIAVIIGIIIPLILGGSLIYKALDQGQTFRKVHNLAVKTQEIKSRATDQGGRQKPSSSKSGALTQTEQLQKQVIGRWRSVKFNGEFGGGYLSVHHGDNYFRKQTL